MSDYTDQQLEALLDDIETDRVERQESARDGDRICQTICAFANDLPEHRTPGLLFIGVKDNGIPSHLPITDQLLQNLASIRDNGNIVPSPSLDVQKRTLKGSEIAVVIVHPATTPPVRYKGTVWIRSGPRRAIANSEDERRLNEKRRFGDLPADVQPIPSAVLAELDDMLFRRTYLPAAVAKEVIEQNQRTFEHDSTAAKEFVSATCG